jgi:hypothetical protein
MNAPATQRRDSAARAVTLSGLAIAVSAVLGAHVVMGAPADRHAPATAKLIAAVPAPMFDTGGLLIITGAAVMLVAWLQRQGLRSIVRNPRLIPIRMHPARADRAAQLRKQSITHHIGGLHGP